MAALRDFEPDALVHGLVDNRPVTLTNVETLGERLLLVHYEGPRGPDRDFITRAFAKKLKVKRRWPVRSMRRYPAGVPRLFASMDDVAAPLLRARGRNALHAIVEEYIALLASRLANPLNTVKEIFAVVGARNDALSVAPDHGILFEVFGTASRVEEDLRKLERDTTTTLLKVAVVLDHELDSKLFDKFTRRLRGSPVQTWLRVGDLLLEERFRKTAQIIDRAVERLLYADAPDQLRVVDFDLYGDHQQWERVPDIPFGYDGLGESNLFGDLEDPVFFVDIQNTGTREARIYEAFIYVRFRHTKLHGIPGENVLKPACMIALPLNDGEQGYRSIRLDEPILVPAGKHVRVLVRLDNAGFAWRGEVDVGMRYGAGKSLHVPALSIFR
jgi:hypothetical protein